MLQARQPHAGHASLFFSHSLPISFWFSFSFRSLNAWTTLSVPTPFTGSNPSGTLMRTHIFYWLSIWLRQWSLSPGVEVEICPTFVAASRGTSRQPDCLPTGCVFLKVLGQQIMPSICLLLWPVSFLSSLCFRLSLSINWLVLLEKGLANAENACQRHHMSRAEKQLHRRASYSYSYSPSLKQFHWAFAAFSCDICSMSFKCLSTAYDNEPIGLWQMTALIDIEHIKGYWEKTQNCIP